jgi:hypothetical protein
MKRAEAVTVVKMLDDVVRSRRGAALYIADTPTSLALIWITEIEKIEDAELATRAVAQLFTTTRELPTPLDFREIVKKLQQDARDTRPAIEEGVWARTPPRWVKGWLVARHRHHDMRVWPQQKPGYDAMLKEHPHTRTHVWAEQQQISPEDAERYEAEGDKLSPEQLRTLLPS